MLVIVRLDLTEEGQENKSVLLEEVDYSFNHKWVVSTEIVDIMTKMAP